MNKIKIMDQVIVYRNLFSDNDLKILMDEIIKSYKNTDGMIYANPEDSSYKDYHGPQPYDKGDGTLIQEWQPWYTYGSKSIWGSPKNNQLNDLQSIGYKLLFEAILKSYKDYVLDYSKNGKWTYEIKEWEVGDTNESSIVFSNLEILKHKKNINTKYTINPHTDWHNHRKDDPGPKQVLTFTIYLNDDYEGGEVDFVDEQNKHLIVYKPKKGDLTIFPSGQPFWHGARAVTSDQNKFFIRTFIVYRNPVSKEWMDGLRINGPARWMEMELEKDKSIVDAGLVDRQIVFKGDSPNKSKNLFPLFIEKETYIDGRQI
jgi:hypothetical protein